MKSRENEPRKFFRLKYTVCGIAFAALAGGVLASTFVNPVLAQDKFRIATPNPQGLSLGVAPLFMSLKMGYFKQEGIDVEIINLQGSTIVHTQVAQKQVDVGWDAPIDFRQPDRTALPTKFFYNHMRRWIWEFAVPAESEIRTLTDFKGKQIGVGALNWYHVPVSRAILMEAGLQANDFQIIAVGLGGTAFRAVNSGRVDALNLFDSMHDIFASTGKKIRRIPIPEHYFELFSNGYFAHEDTIKERGAVLGAFGRANSKGTVACYANVKACIEAYYEFNPQRRPRSGTPEQNLANAMTILQTRALSFLGFKGGEVPLFGQYSRSSWESYINALHAQGVLKIKDIPVEELYTNAFVPVFNDFSVGEVVRAAQALK